MYVRKYIDIYILILYILGKDIFIDILNLRFKQIGDFLRECILKEISDVRFSIKDFTQDPKALALSTGKAQDRSTRIFLPKSCNTTQLLFNKLDKDARGAAILHLIYKFQGKSTFKKLLKVELPTLLKERKGKGKRLAAKKVKTKLTNKGSIPKVC